MPYFNPALLIKIHSQGCQIWSTVSASSILIEYSNTCLTDNFEHIIISTDRFFWNCPHHFEDFEIQYSFTSAPISTNLISFSLGAAPTLDSWNWLELNTASVEIILPINQYMMMRMTGMMMMMMRREGERETSVSERFVQNLPRDWTNNIWPPGSLDLLMIKKNYHHWWSWSLSGYKQYLTNSWWSWPW